MSWAGPSFPVQKEPVRYVSKSSFIRFSVILKSSPADWILLSGKGGQLSSPQGRTFLIAQNVRRAQVVCGGVWHNVVLSAGCWLLALLLPFLLWPAYSSGHGAVLRCVSFPFSVLVSFLRYFHRIF